MRCHSRSGQPSGLLFQKTMGAAATGKKPKGGGSVSALRTRRRNKRLGPEEDRTLTQWAECRDKNGGGIEPMEKIFLLTFLFIGLAEFPVPIQV